METHFLKLSHISWVSVLHASVLQQAPGWLVFLSLKPRPISFPNSSVLPFRKPHMLHTELTFWCIYCFLISIFLTLFSSLVLDGLTPHASLLRILILYACSYIITLGTPFTFKIVLGCITNHEVTIATGWWRSVLREPGHKPICYKTLESAHQSQNSPGSLLYVLWTLFLWKWLFHELVPSQDPFPMLLPLIFGFKSCSLFANLVS